MSSDQRKYSLRPQPSSQPRSTATALEGAFRVWLAPSELQLLAINHLENIVIRSEITGTSGIAVAWRATDNVGAGKNPVLRVTDLLRSTYAFELDDKYTISRLEKQLPIAHSITLKPIVEDKGRKAAITEDDIESWLRVSLRKLSLVKYS
jgi:hypothetical protein